ncbi:MAG: hypothetical protein HC836_10515 [Richelia sp. RM2_1_2]|nr:hypothetical protein [Richelia sp. RM2_1_2]
MRYIELINEKKNEKPEGSSDLDLPKELSDWMRSEGIKEASLHTLWSDFPLRRHLPTSSDWSRVLNSGERKGYWRIEPGRQEGSKLIVRKVKKDNTK